MAMAVASSQLQATAGLRVSEIFEEVAVETWDL